MLDALFVARDLLKLIVELYAVPTVPLSSLLVLISSFAPELRLPNLLLSINRFPPLFVIAAYISLFVRLRVDPELIVIGPSKTEFFTVVFELSPVLSFTV